MGAVARLFAALLAVAGLAACSNPFESDDSAGRGDDDAATDDDTTPTADDDTTPAPSRDDYCGAPTVIGGANSAWVALFDGVTVPTDPALAPAWIYPQPDTRYPRNWPAPTWRWVAQAASTRPIWIEVRVEGQECPLRVLLDEGEVHGTWTFHTALWDLLRDTGGGLPATVRLAAAAVDGYGNVTAGPWAGNERPIGISPFGAPPKLAYWSTATQALHRLTIGESSTYWYGPATNGGYCVGCHAQAPGGNELGVSIYDGAVGDFVVWTIDTETFAGVQTCDVTQLRQADTTWPAFSDTWWDEVVRRVVVVQQGRLYSADLSTCAWQWMAVDGDGASQAEPVWSPDGSTVVYASSTEVHDGRTAGAPVDLRAVPYGDGGGGVSTPIPGASDPSWQEYYPDFTPDGRYLAFNRTTGDTYSSPSAEVFVIPATGGTAVRLASNDPPPETGQVSPGVKNSFPRWARAFQDMGGERWYYLTFSSTRDLGLPQVWIAPVSVDGAGVVHSYPALYVPGQDAGTDNHTPIWTGD